MLLAYAPYDWKIRANSVIQERCSIIIHHEQTKSEGRWGRPAATRSGSVRLPSRRVARAGCRIRAAPTNPRRLETCSMHAGDSKVCPAVPRLPRCSSGKGLVRHEAALTHQCCQQDAFGCHLRTASFTKPSTRHTPASEGQQYL
jgi:hypothetical protein